MNILSCILTVTAFGLGATSVHLYSKLDAERSEAAAQIAPCRDEQVQIATLQQACVALELDAMQSEGLPAQDPEDDSLEPAFGRPHPGIRESPLGACEFQATPAGREFFRTRHEAALRRMFGGIAEELNLSPDQEAELLALLLQQQTEQIETTRKFAGDRAAMTSALNDLWGENTTELMAGLGDKYLQFEDFQKTLGERMQIEQAAMQLEAANVPLRQEQREDLLAVMVEERERMPGPAWVPGAPVQEYATQQQAWQEEYEVRVRDRVASVLSSDQLKQYDVYRNLQSTTRRRQLETWRDAPRRPLNTPRNNPGPS